MEDDETPVELDASDAASRFQRRLTVIVALGAIWRFGFVIATKRHRELLLNDSLYYSWQGVQLADGVWFRDILAANPAAEHGPLTAVLLAPVSWGSHALFQQRLMTTACGVVTIALVGLVGRRIGGDRAGLVAAGLAAVYPNLWINDGLVMSESLGCMLVAAFLLVALQLVERPGVRSALAAGALIGLGALTRSELIVLLPLLWIVVARWTRPRNEALKSIALATVGTIVVLSPWVAFNMTRFDRPVLLTTNDGSTLVGANCDETYRGAALGGWSLFCVLNTPGPVGADDSVRSAEQRRAALSYVRDNLTRVPIVVIARVARTADLYGISNLVHQDVGEERDRWASWAGIVSWWLLAPIAAFGLQLARRRDAWILAMPLVAVVATTVLFYGTHRIRSPLEPALVVAAGLAIAHWSARSRPERVAATG
ncbi:MAG: ArnT family glycosyltransferase [Acidimicrobiia bacterium]